MESNVKVNGSKVLIMGLIFKENVPNLRNGKVAKSIESVLGKIYKYEIIIIDDSIDRNKVVYH